jgi:hypothetical protein
VNTTFEKRRFDAKFFLIFTVLRVTIERLHAIIYTKQLLFVLYFIAFVTVHTIPLSKSSYLFGQSEYSLGEPYILTKHGPNVGEYSKEL